MSRRIAYLSIIAAAATFAAPAVADRECFDNTCRMPEVIEAPEAPPAAVDPNDGNLATAAAARQGQAPQPIGPQMAVDPLPRPALKPAPYRAAEPAPADKPVRVRQTSRPDAVNEPVEIVSRQYGALDQRNYLPPMQPGAGVVVVVPGVQYGADGIGLEEGRQNSAWELCQRDRPNGGRCSPYNYQPYGPYGYRPLGSYRPQHSAPAYVYVPDAKIITLDSND